MVSESIVDKIAEFIIHATEQLSKYNISRNIDNIQENVSKEDEKYGLRNIGNQRKQKITTRRDLGEDYFGKRTTGERQKSKYWKVESEPSTEESEGLLDNEPKILHNESYGKSYEFTRMQEKTTKTNRWWDKFENIRTNKNTGQPSNFFEQISKTTKSYWVIDDNEMTKNKLLADEERPKHNHYDKHDNENNDKKQEYHNNNDIETNYRQPKSNLHVANFFSTNKDRNSFIVAKKPLKYHKYESQRLDKYALRSGETPVPVSKYIKNKKREYKKDTNDFNVYKNSKYENSEREADFVTYNNMFRGRDFSLTTKKEKTDFDQYENLNYPKAETYIATSGAN